MMRLRPLFSLVAGLAAGALACSDSGPEPVSEVALSVETLLLNSGAESLVVASVNGKGGKPLEGRRVQWVSPDTTVARVDSTGRVRAGYVLGSTERQVVISATSGGRSSFVGVRVLPSAVATIGLGATASLDAGGTRQLEPVLRDVANNTLTGRPTSYLSRDTSVARVSATGLITASGFVGASNRTTYVVVSVDGIADSLAVTVAPTTVASVTVTPGQPYLAPGSTRRLRAVAKNPSGVTVGGVTVDWSSADIGIATVNAAGVATGVALGDVNITATASGQSGSALVSVNTCGAAPAGEYTIEIRYTTGLANAAVAEAFTCAAQRIRAAIRTQLAPINYANLNANACVPGLTLNETINGLVIYATVEPIDGAGGVLGSAGPCYARPEDGLPAVGRMRFDVDDLANMQANGTLRAVIMHEMLHVIGVGTLWSAKGWLFGVGTNPRFGGTFAREACITFHAGASACAEGVPVEDCVGIPGCGTGTINSHWREATFDKELMTGYIDLGQNPFSRMTIQSLADLGYGVDPDQSDDYSLAALGGPALRVLSPTAIAMPEPFRLLGYVDRRGRFYPSR